MICISQADVEHWRTLYFIDGVFRKATLVVQLSTVERLEGGKYSTGDWRGRPDGEIVAYFKTVKRSCHGPDRR